MLRTPKWETLNLGCSCYQKAGPYLLEAVEQGQGLVVDYLFQATVPEWSDPFNLETMRVGDYFWLCFGVTRVPLGGCPLRLYDRYQLC
jgi:hypothetical protein